MFALRTSTPLGSIVTCSESQPNSPKESCQGDTVHFSQIAFSQQAVLKAFRRNCSQLLQRSFSGTLLRSTALRCVSRHQSAEICIDVQGKIIQSAPWFQRSLLSHLRCRVVKGPARPGARPLANAKAEGLLMRVVLLPEKSCLLWFGRGLSNKFGHGGCQNERLR